jgi:hypothetical protein
MMTKTLAQWAHRYQTDVETLEQVLPSIRHNRTGEHITIRSTYSQTWLALRLGLIPSVLMPGTKPTEGDADYSHETARLINNGN